MTTSARRSSMPGQFDSSTNSSTPTTEQPQALSKFFLQSPIRPENLALVQAAAGRETNPEARLRTMLVSLLSLPEYQLA